MAGIRRAIGAQLANAVEFAVTKDWIYGGQLLSAAQLLI
ncbi:hypothetical protein RGUI_1092 [Rhodovulum sp. P5]|nr:hypothetical protein RGUI_1092 [Rhodovulum sp. P5]